jgi:hypothetical protein
VTKEFIGWTEKMKEKIYFNLLSPSEEIINGGETIKIPGIIKTCF